MKRSSPLTMEARIRQARRDVLRRHNYAEYARKNPFKATMKRIGKVNMVLWSIILLTVCVSSWFRPVALLVMMAALGAVLYALSWLSSASNDGIRYREALEFLTGTYDLRAIGPLAEAYWLRNPPVSVPGALTRLLRVQNQMQVSVALDNRQRYCLYRVLTRRSADELDLQLAILEFLEIFGDVRALSEVRALAEDEARCPRLQTAALRCYAALQTEQAELAGRQTLLRSTRAPASPSEQLLHPAPVSPEAPQEELLRAVNHAE